MLTIGCQPTANHPEQATTTGTFLSYIEGGARRRISNMWYVYILECKDGALYTGITDNVERRYKEHVTGKGGHYTSFNWPTKIIYKESYPELSLAEKSEQQIKSWSKTKKLA